MEGETDSETDRQTWRS